MSYSNNVKKEIISKYYEKYYNDMIKTASYIYGYILSSNVIGLDFRKYENSGNKNENNDEKIIITSTNEDVIYFFDTLLKKFAIYGDVITNSRLKKVEIEKNDFFKKIIAFDTFQKDEKSFLAGLFLSNGRISNPEKEYHLEINYLKQNDKIIAGILANDKICDFKKMEKGENVKLYIGNGDSIADFLLYFSLTKSISEFENIRIEKELKNTINRQVNLEMANLTKSIDTAKKQIDAIGYIYNNNLENNLTEKQKEIAKIRKKYPTKKLTEISEILGISKSTASSRMKAILNLVEKDKKDKKEKKNSKDRKEKKN